METRHKLQGNDENIIRVDKTILTTVFNHDHLTNVEQHIPGHSHKEE